MPMNRLVYLSLALLLAGASLAVHAAPAKHHPRPKAAAKPKKAGHEGEIVHFSQWKQVGAFLDELSARDGFDRAELGRLMDKVQYVESTVQLMKPFPAGKPKNWRAYSERFIEPKRIQAGVEFWQRYAAQLAQAEDRWGVPADIIVGIIGVETFYGRNTGNFRVLDALTTLGFAYPDLPNKEARMQFFRGEIENTLLYARENQMDPFELRGSYAGAIGWPQFMPSSIRSHAVDFDGDGRIDLRNSPVDAIGSVANFLVRHGWQRGGPLVYKVQAAASVNTAAPWTALLGRGMLPELTRETLANYKLTSSTDIPLALPLGLIDLQNGFDPTEYWIGSDNFFAITKYNRSYFYAMSVIDLGKAVEAARNTRQ
jgi:membrane-bound lytic murein transglycosylase B